VYQTLSKILVKTSGHKVQADTHVKTLLLLHGWGMNSQVWEPIREALEAKYHVIWVDLPGHGFNRHLDAQGLEQMASLVAEITPSDTHIIGWSLGGMVAQAVAQIIPDRLKSLTLVASTPRFSQTENDVWQHAMSDEVLLRFADSLKQDTVKTLKGFIALQFIGVKNSKAAQDKLIQHILNNDNTEEYAKKWGGVILNDNKTSNSASDKETNNIPTQEALDVGLGILQNADLRLLKPSCPEHWIFAEYDRLIPKEVINDLISLRPDAQITLLDKAGHAPFITHPELFLNQVIDFIETQPF